MLFTPPSARAALRCGPRSSPVATRQTLERARRVAGVALVALAALTALTAGACGGTTIEVDKGSGGGSSTSGVGGGGNASSSGSTGAGGTISDACGPIGALGSIELGDIAPDVATSFEICDNTVGFSTLVTTPNETDGVGVTLLKPPTGSSVIVNFHLANHVSTAFTNLGWVLAADPQSNSPDAFPVQAGKWAFRVKADNGVSALNTSVWYRRSVDGAFHGGVVDVNVFIAPNAATQASISDVLTKVFPLAGLDLGAVQFFQLPAAYSIINSRAELAAMFKESSGLTTMPSLNLFVIGAFDQNSPDFPQGAIGIAGGLPGSPMVHGTGRSGLAYQPSGQPAFDASVLRHEAGHYMGLFHTTEIPLIDGVVETDPLDDTPSCTNAMINSNNPENCPDASNEMFPWAIPGVLGTEPFTPQQEIVIHGSLVYRGVAQAGGVPAPPQPAVLPAGAKPMMPLAPDLDAAQSQAQTPRRVQGAVRPPVDALERVMSSVWCADTHVDYIELALRLAGPSGGARLRALAEDPSVLGVVRARALTAFMRASTRGRASSTAPAEKGAALAFASSIARDEEAGTDLRLAALASLAAADASAALSARAAAVTSADPLVRAFADGLVIQPSKRAAEEPR